MPKGIAAAEEIKHMFKAFLENGMADAGACLAEGLLRASDSIGKGSPGCQAKSMEKAVQCCRDCFLGVFKQQPDQRPVGKFPAVPGKCAFPVPGPVEGFGIKQCVTDDVS